MQRPRHERRAAGPRVAPPRARPRGPGSETPGQPSLRRTAAFSTSTRQSPRRAEQGRPSPVARPRGAPWPVGEEVGRRPSHHRARRRAWPLDHTGDRSSAAIEAAERAALSGSLCGRHDGRVRDGMPNGCGNGAVTGEKTSPGGGPPANMGTRSANAADPRKVPRARARTVPADARSIVTKGHDRGPAPKPTEH
jgi:hypothetical protein